MSKPFKLRYANEIAGLFVLGILVVTVGTLFVMGHSQEWFKKARLYAVELPEEGSYGLQDGAQVQYQGTIVGRVEEIRVDEGRMTAHFSIQSSFGELVRTNTVARLRRMWEVAGDTLLELSTGDEHRGAPLPENGSLAPATFDAGLMDVVRKSLDEEILPTIREIRAAAEQARLLASDLRQHAEPLRPLLTRLDGVVGTLETDQGLVQLLLKDTELATEVRDAIILVKQLARQLTSVTESVRTAIAHLPEISKSLRLELDDLPGSVLQLRSLLSEAEQLIEGVQRHWLLKSYMEQSGGESIRLRASQAAGSGGTSP